MKTLVLSDIHYPSGISSACFEAVRSEKPDIVVLLGDIVVGRGERLLHNMREFLGRYPHPLGKSVVLVGDNEYKGNREVVRFVERLPKINEDPFKYMVGNMFFAHGNVEGGGPLSDVSESLGAVLAKLAKPATPLLVSKLARTKYALSKDMYAFLGHIHFLGYVGATRTTFCGTFSTRRIVFDPKESLGYVVVEHSNRGFVAPNGIKIVRKY